MKGTAKKYNRTNPPARKRALAPRPLTTCVLAALAQCAAANPTGHQVAAGSATVQASGKTLTVTNTPGAILNWQSFSIAPGELTRFVQQSSASAVLNRVVAANPSSIMGTLASNGRVFLVNPHGLVIGAGALIDTAGFVGSTLNIADKDFLAGKLKFEGGGAGVLRNEGTIRATRDIFLVGPKIENAGIVHSASGDVVLAAGKSVTITSPDAHGVQFGIQAPEDSVVNLGTIQASSAVGLFAGTLKHSGEIKVTSASLDSAGRVVLAAQKDIILDGNSKIAVDNSVGKGGQAQVLGERVGLFDSATITATGAAGGGEILIGGDYQGANPAVRNAFRTFVGPDASLDASATARGDGGKAIVWADGYTQFFGSASVRAGALSGNGGLVETSGKEGLTVHGARVALDAPAGRGGRWLLDPKNIIIETGNGNFNGNTIAWGNNDGGTTSIGPNFGATGGPVEIQAANDIEIRSNTTTSASVPVTMRAGRSILVRANITTNNNNLTLIANDSTVPAPQQAQRDAGAAELTMDPGTTISTGTGRITLTMDSGIAGAASGNITIANLTGANVSVLHNGPTANGKIVRAADFGAVAALISVPGTGGNGHVHLEIENNAGGADSGIGIEASNPFAARPIQVRATAGGGTVHLESHYHRGGRGIFIDVDGNVQIGGATNVFNGLVNGVQALTLEGSGVGAGPVRVTATGTLSQEQKGIPPTNEIGVCGNAAGTNAMGGAVCSGEVNAGGAFLARTNDVTLRGANMVLRADTQGVNVNLLPTSGTTIGLIGGAGAFQLDATEIALITASALRIGERVASGDASSSGNVTFGGTLNVPGTASFELRTGGSITASGAATDIATNNAAITLRGGGAIGATGAARFKVNPGNGAFSAISSGNLFVERSGVGSIDLSTFQLSISGGTPPLIFEFATTDGDINVPSRTFTNGDVTLVAGGAGRNINFTGTGTFTNLDAFRLNPTGSTTFNSGTQTFANTPVLTSRPIVVGGGIANFGGAVTATTATGTLTISGGGEANFNSATASSFAGAVSLTGSILGGTGTGNVNANGGLTWTGGTISKTGGAVTVPGTTTINSGTPTLSGNLSLDTLNYTGGTLTMAAPAILSLTGSSAKTIDGSSLTIANGATLRLSGSGNLVLNSGATLTNNGTFDFQSDAGIQYTTAPIPTFTNAAGATLRKSGGTTSIIGISNPINFVNAGTLDAAMNTTINFASNNTFNNGTQFTGAGTNLVTTGTTFNGTSTSANLTLESGNFNGTADLAGTTAWTGGTIIGTLTVPAGATLNLNGAGAKTVAGGTASLTNSGTINVVGTGNLLLNAGATVTNNNTFDFQSDAGIQYTVAPIPTFTNAAGATLKKTGTAGTTSIIGISNPINFVNNGTLNAAANTTFNYASNNSFNDGTQFTGGGSNLVTTGATFTGTSTSANLTLQSGNFGGGGSLAGTTAWTGGTIIGTLTVPAGATLNLTGTFAKTVAGGTASLTNSGTTNMVGTGNLVLNSGAMFANNGTFDFQSDAGIQYTAAPIPTFTNAAGATLKKTGTAGTTSIIGISNPFNFVNSGTLNAAANTTINYASNNSFNDGTQFTGGGSNLVTTGATFTGTSTSANLTLQSGNFGGGGSLAGTTTWTGGAITGTLTVPAGATLNLTGTGGTIVDGGTVINVGTTNMVGTGNLVLNSGATFTNNGTFDFQSDAGIQYTAAPIPTFTNAAGATLKKTGTAGTTSIIGISNPFNFVNSGTLNAAANTTINYASNNTFNGGTQFTGAGSNLVTTGATFSGTSTSANLTLQSGNFNGGGSLAGITAWTGGTINGHLTVADGAMLNLTGGSAKTVDGAITLTNAGTINVIGGGNLVLNSGATLTNNGTFDFQSDAGIQYTTAPVPTFMNAAGATLKKTGTAGTTSVIGISNPLNLTNAGTINPQIGTIQVNGGFATNNGTINVAAGAAFSTNGNPFTNNGTLAGNGNVLLGAGVLLTNNGTISPGVSPGTLTITGDLTMTGSSMTNIQIGGLAAGTEYDVLNVTGRVDLAGTLNVTHVNAFSPVIGNSFRIITHGSRTGAFATNNFPAGFNYTGPSSVSDYTITVSGAPTTNTWNGTTSTWETPGHWSLGHVPQSYEDAVIPDVGPPGISETITVSATGQAARSVTSAENLLIAGGGSLTLGSQNSAVTGSLAVIGGTLVTNGALAANGGLAFQSGLIQAPGGLTLAGVSGWSGGSFTGQVTVSGGATLALTGAGTKGLSGGTLTNAMGGVVIMTDSGNLQLANGASVVNNGFFFMQSGAGIHNNPATATTFANAGLLQKTISTGTSVIGNTNQLTLTNSSTGSILVQSGTLQVNASFPTNSGTISTATGTVFSTNGAPLTSTGLIRGTGTMLLGSGVTLTNNGTLTPGASPGRLIIDGNYTQGTNGVLVIDIAGTQQGVTYDLLSVTGAANLAGTLHVILAPSYAPGTNDIYNFLTYASLTGNFTNFILPPGFIVPQPGPFGYGVSTSSGVSMSSGATMSTNTATNDVVALKDDEKTSGEALEKVQEDDNKKEKGATCS